MPFRHALFLVAALPLQAAAGPAALRVARVDALDRVFPDRPPPAASETKPIHIPRGGVAAFQFAVTSGRAGACRVRVGRITGPDGAAFPGEERVFVLLPVHVEANTAGSMKTRPGVKPPAGWMRYFVRAAPYDVAEVLAESDTLRLQPGRTAAALVEVAAPLTARPGRYAGALVAEAGGERAEARFAFVVHRTAAPPRPALHVTHWLWPQPKNLVQGDPPAWWSERHWRLLERAGRQLRAFGQDTIFTPLVNYRSPLIQIVRRADGSYAFDYARFDRWVRLFFGLGFQTIEGHHIVSAPARWAGGVYVLDEKTGRKEPLLPERGYGDAWLKFIPAFYRSLHAHLEAKGWTRRYVQHQYDEPRRPELYRRLAELAKTYLPGVRTIDAINSRPQVFSRLVDIQVFNLLILERFRSLVAARSEAGRAVWLYHCTSPYPPYPNRHLDGPLTESRLWPWLCFRLGAQGYLFWAANNYRGADEYKTSIGPLPNGSQSPGHPPGDAWLFYRGPNGLRGSLRMVAFRDGLLDHALLTMLRRRNPAQAEAILRSVVPSPKAAAREPAAYHRARRELLARLDARP